MLILGLGALVLVTAAVAAVVLTQSNSPGGATPSATRSIGITTPSPADGASLPLFVPGIPDPAVGQTMPTVSGASFDGTPRALQPDGRPKVLLFLAHWCPHCQREVPVVQSWIAANGMPATVELMSIVTAIDPNRPNYPPEAWLAGEGWQVPVIVDGDNRIADQFGLSAFPYWVAVNADGSVASRLTGELSPAEIDALVGSVATPTAPAVSPSISISAGPS